MPDVQRFRADARCHGQGHWRWDGRRIVADRFGDERSQTHFFEHVQVVVGGRAVRADTHVESHFKHLGDRRKTGSQFQVGRGIVRHARAGVQQRAHLAQVDMHTMCCDDLGFEQSLLLDIRDDRHALLVAHGFTLEGGLRQVGVQWHIELSSQFGGGA